MNNSSPSGKYASSAILSSRQLRLAEVSRGDFSRFGEVNMQINEEKQKYVEAMRAIDNSKREIYQNMETDRARLNAQIAETRDAVMFHTNDRVEKAKEDLTIKLRDVERVSSF